MSMMGCVQDCLSWLVTRQMRDITMGGPYSAKEAVDNGLITGISYRQYVLDSVLEAEHGGSEDNKLMVRSNLCSARLP